MILPKGFIYFPAQDKHVHELHCDETEEKKGGAMRGSGGEGQDPKPWGGAGEVQASSSTTRMLRRAPKSPARK